MQELVKEIRLEALDVRVENEEFWSVILRVVVAGENNVAICGKEVIFKVNGEEFARVLTNDFGEALTDPKKMLFVHGEVAFTAQIAGTTLKGSACINSPKPPEIDLEITKNLIAVYEEDKQIWDVSIKAVYQGRSVSDLEIIFINGEEIFSERTNGFGIIQRRLKLDESEAIEIRVAGRQKKYELTCLELPEIEAVVQEKDFYIDSSGNQVTTVQVCLKRGAHPVRHTRVGFFWGDNHESYAAGEVVFSGFDSRVGGAVGRTDDNGCIEQTFSIRSSIGQVKIITKGHEFIVPFHKLVLSNIVRDYKVNDDGTQTTSLKIFAQREADSKYVKGQKIAVRSKGDVIFHNRGGDQERRTDENSRVLIDFTIRDKDGQVEIGLEGKKVEFVFHYCKPVLNFTFKTASRNTMYSGHSDRRYIELSGILSVYGPRGTFYLSDCCVVVSIEFHYAFLKSLPSKLEDEVMRRGETDCKGFVRFEEIDYMRYKKMHSGAIRDLVKVMLKVKVDGKLILGGSWNSGECDISSNFETKLWERRDFTSTVKS